MNVYIPLLLFVYIAQLPEEGQGQLSKPPSAVTTKSKQDTMDKPQSMY